MSPPTIDKPIIKIACSGPALARILSDPIQEIKMSLRSNHTKEVRPAHSILVSLNKARCLPCFTTVVANKGFPG